MNNISNYIKKLIRMAKEKIIGDTKRTWNNKFLNYTEFIVSHPNYKGLYFERGSDGNVKWVITGKSVNGKKRREWWDNQCNIYRVKIEAGCYAKIALKIHPTKLHTCQICGRELSIEYVYPNKRTLKLIEKNFEKNIKPFDKDIFDIIDALVKTTDDIEKMKSVFKIDTTLKLSKENLKIHIRKNIVDTYSKGSLSPGVMSNSPDRFDGYHSDGACCRHKSDKGRHKSNLQRYGQDRRVYENWADGNWKMADRLMSEFRKSGVSADHIGPISLGFCHRPKFNPLSKEENSAKNNRMSLEDVNELLQDEKTEQIVSWHSQSIWDELKNKVKTDKDAIKLSDLMRKNIHHVLIIFSMIDDKGYKPFLESFLNPQHSFFDYKFEGFDPKTGRYEKVTSKELTGKNQKNNTERYYRVAFDKLKEYKEIDNRKVNIWKNDDVDKEIEKLFTLLKVNSFKDAKTQLDKTLKLLAEISSQNW